VTRGQDFRPPDTLPCAVLNFPVKTRAVGTGPADSAAAGSII